MKIFTYKGHTKGRELNQKRREEKGRIGKKREEKGRESKLDLDKN